MKIKFKLAGWIFNQLYWFDIKRLPRKKWKDTAFMMYLALGMDKRYKQGAFDRTWDMIKRKGLMREGKKCKQKVRFHKKKKEKKDAI